MPLLSPTIRETSPRVYAGRRGARVYVYAGLFVYRWQRLGPLIDTTIRFARPLVLRRLRRNATMTGRDRGTFVRHSFRPRFSEHAKKVILPSRHPRLHGNRFSTTLGIGLARCRLHLKRFVAFKRENGSKRFVACGAIRSPSCKLYWFNRCACSRARIHWI